MAYDIIGTVYKVGTTETIPTKSGNTITRRTLILEQRRYDPNTGQEYQPNYPALEFTGQQCPELDRHPQGSRVRVRFDVQGSLYADKQTGEERSISRLRAFRIEPYQQPVQQYQQQPVQPVQQPVQYQQPVQQQPVQYQQQPVQYQQQPVQQYQQPVQQQQPVQYRQDDIPF